MKKIETHNWYNPEGQIIPEDAIPKQYRKKQVLPGGKIQIIDIRYAYRY